MSSIESVTEVINDSCGGYGSETHQFLHDETLNFSYQRIYSYDSISANILYKSTRHNLYMYFYPFIYAIGIPGNVVSAILWLQPTLRTATGLYFASLAISDTLILLFHLRFVLQVLFDIEAIRSNIHCQIFNSLFTATECLSINLVLGITVERFIIVCYPFHRKRLCNMRRTMTVICLLVAFALGVGIVEGILWTYDTNLHSCVISKRRLESKSTVEIWNMVIVSIAFFVPIVTISIINIVIIRKIRKSRMLHKKMGKESHALERRISFLGKQVDKDNSYILLVLAFYVVLSESPESVCYFIQAHFQPDSCIDPASKDGTASWERYFRFLFISAIFEAFSLTNYAINCLVYSLLGRKFRAKIRELLCTRSTAHRYNVH
jgi:hypothetical protein